MAFPDGKPEGLSAKLDPFDEFVPVDAVSQVVAGTNYFVKVRAPRPPPHALAAPRAA